MWESSLIPSSSSQVLLLNHVHLSPSGTHPSCTHPAGRLQLPGPGKGGKAWEGWKSDGSGGKQNEQCRKDGREEGESTQTKTLRDSK